MRGVQGAIPRRGHGQRGRLLQVRTDLYGRVSPDKFRIKVWDKATDTIVYDNQMGSSDDAAPSTSIAGGSIVIHK